MRIQGIEPSSVPWEGTTPDARLVLLLKTIIIKQYVTDYPQLRLHFNLVQM